MTVDDLIQKLQLLPRHYMIRVLEGTDWFRIKNVKKLGCNVVEIVIED